MKKIRNLTPILVASLGLSTPLIGFCDVKSLTSSELTETYVKDSTIIVTPKKQQSLTQQKTFASLSIAPSEQGDESAELEKHANRHMDNSKTAVELDEDDLRELSIERALREREQELQTLVANLDGLYDELNAPPLPEILQNDPRFAVPTGESWERMYAGGELGIKLEGDQFTFSIGNPTGINPIDVPDGGFQGDNVSLTPRDNGGFDLTFTVPQNN